MRDALGDELNRVEYSVAGEANLTRSLERNAELQLALSKHDYAPGEDIEIAIRAPYAGNGLITIERDKVYAHQWFKAATSGSVQKITVPKDFEGNGYVNVQFVRDPSSDEIFMSPLSYGVVPFSVNRDARRDVLTVDVPTLVKPGDTLTMKAQRRAVGARRRVRGRRRHPAGRPLQARRPARLLLPQAHARREDEPDSRSDPARVLEARSAWRHPAATPTTC